MSKKESNDSQRELGAYHGSGQQGAELLMGVGSWMVCSVGMLVFNKLAAGVLPVCTLIALQFFFTVVALLVFGWSTIHIGSVYDVLRWCRVIPFFTGMLLSSILALKYAPMTLVITFRALSPVVSMLVERCYPNPIRVTPLTLVAIGIMFLGMMVYMMGMDITGMTMDMMYMMGIRHAAHDGVHDGHDGVHDGHGHDGAHTTHLIGIFWAVLNNFLAVGDRLLQRLMLAKDQNPVDISKSGATLLNNLLGVIPLAATALILEEWNEIPAAIQELTPLSVVWIVASCIVGAGISYTGIWAQSLISATSFLVLVNANKFFIIFLECFLSWQFHFGDKTISWTQVLGASISIIGGIAYGKAREMVEREKGYGDLEEEKTPSENGSSSGDSASE